VYSGDWTAALEELAREAGAFGILRTPIQPQLLRSEVLRAGETWPDGWFGHPTNGRGIRGS
jgi:hypothetical protein